MNNKTDLTLLHTLCGATREMPTCYADRSEIYIPLSIPHSISLSYTDAARSVALSDTIKVRHFIKTHVKVNDCGCRVHHFMERLDPEKPTVSQREHDEAVWKHYLSGNSLPYVAKSRPQ